tara:strand:- start:229 stop:516 length:288 start_codon:yes stop_codon:yes gene_type:complete
MCDKPINFGRMWSRTENICDVLTPEDRKERQEKRNSEALKHKNNSTKLTKKQQYAQVVKGYGGYRKTSWATQSFSATHTDPNTQDLSRIGNVLRL